MTFYTALWNVPGYLPDSCEPPPVFKDYNEAAEYLADTLLGLAMDYEPGDKDGDTFERMAEECRGTTEEAGFATDGPDGYRYSVEETESRGRWTAGPEHHDPDTGDFVVLSYTERQDGLGPTARETADDVSSVCGSMVEQPREDDFAYVHIESGRLAEAAGELRESGFELEDIEGELIETE